MNLLPHFTVLIFIAVVQIAAQGSTTTTKSARNATGVGIADEAKKTMSQRGNSSDSNGETSPKPNYSKQFANKNLKASMPVTVDYSR